jgi:hypothetical protein
MTDAELEALIDKQLKGAKPHIQRLLKIAITEGNEHPVKYSQSRHWQIDKMFELLWANSEVIAVSAKRRATELDARLTAIEEHLTAIHEGRE